MEAKGSKLRLFLKDKNHKIAKQLEENKVIVNQVPETLISEHTFSILLHHDIKSIIIRNKLSRDVKIEVEEYEHNPTLVDVSLDMLDASKL
jgi:hypothetical protein